MITGQTMSFSVVPSNNPSQPNNSSSHFSSQSNRVNIKWPVIKIYCASRLGRMPMHVVRAEQAPTTVLIPRDPEQVNHDNKRIDSKKSNANAGGGPNSPIATILSWAAKMFLGSFLVFFPLYKNFLMVEDRIEKTATTVLNVVESVAETVDKVAEDVQRSLPENSNLKKIAQTIEKIGEEIDKDAEVLESFVDKVDDIVDKFDEMVEPIIEGKIALDGSKNTEGTKTGSAA